MKVVAGAIDNTAAAIGAVGLGEISCSDVLGLVQFRRNYQPDGRNRAIYSRLYW